MKRPTHTAFSLVEVVIALGVVGFAIVAILGVLPIGMSTGHAAQDETRASQIAQEIFASLASQAQANYPNVKIMQPATNFSYNIDLSQSVKHIWMSADFDGTFVIVDPSNPADELKHAFQLITTISPNPSGFDSGYASQVTIRVVSPPSPNPNATPTAKQLVRDYVRIISKY